MLLVRAVNMVTLLVFALHYILADNCQYKRYLSASFTANLSQNGTFFKFIQLNAAKNACNEFGRICKGINLEITNNIRNYVLASSDEMQYIVGGLSWKKLCPGHCYFSLTTNFTDGRRYFKKVCPSDQKVSHDSIERLIPSASTSLIQTGQSSRKRLELDENWGDWLQWSPCSQSCGRLGEQKRYRPCISKAPNVICTKISYSTRICNFAKKCPETLPKYFGIHGREGFRNYGTISIFSTCLRTRQSEKLPCGNNYETVSKEVCTQQMSCCFVNDSTFEIDGGPRCFQPKHFVASTGFIEWSVWTPWTRCSVTCGGGTRIRKRICIGNLPSRTACQGPDSQSGTCNGFLCPCDLQPCHNGGICHSNQRISQGYTCQCTQHFIGRNCDFGSPNLICGNDSIVVTFDRRLIEDQGLIDSWKYIHFQGYESQSCFAKLTNDGRLYVLSIPPPIDTSCGSYMLVTGESYSIRNKVLWRMADQSASSTVVLLDLSCDYNKRPNMTTDLGFGIVPTVRTLSFKTLRTEFRINMALYRSPTFSPSSIIGRSPTVAEGEILYLSIDLQTISLTNPENQVLVIDRCFATDTTQKEKLLYEFIKKGCSTNSVFTSVLNNGVSSRGQWAFRVFDWAELSTTNDINIICKVYVCDVAFEVCKPSCDNDITTPSSVLTASNSPQQQNATSQVTLRSTVFNSSLYNFETNRQKRKVNSKNQSSSYPFNQYHPMTVRTRIITRYPTKSTSAINFNTSSNFYHPTRSDNTSYYNLHDWHLLVLVAVISVVGYILLKIAVKNLYVYICVK